jgi:hypothetical protein
LKLPILLPRLTLLEGNPPRIQITQWNLHRLAFHSDGVVFGELWAFHAGEGLQVEVFLGLWAVDAFEVAGEEGGRFRADYVLEFGVLVQEFNLAFLELGWWLLAGEETVGVEVYHQQGVRRKAFISQVGPIIPSLTLFQHCLVLRPVGFGNFQWSFRQRKY